MGHTNQTTNQTTGVLTADVETRRLLHRPMSELPLAEEAKDNSLLNTCVWCVMCVVCVCACDVCVGYFDFERYINQDQ